MNIHHDTNFNQKQLDSLIAHINKYSEIDESEIIITDPSVALINKFNQYFYDEEIISKEIPSYEDVNFFVTGKLEEFSIKVSNWLEINKKISLVNLRRDT